MKTKRFAFPLIISILAILFCRIFQVINPSLSSSTEVVCFFIAFLSFIVVFILNLMIKTTGSDIVIKKNLIVSICSVTSAILIIFDSFVRLISYINVYRDLMQFFIGIFGILSGVTFVIIGVSYYKEKNLFKSQNFITLFPPIWGIFRLLELFFIYNSVSNSPWEMIDEIAVIFLLLFLFNQARTFANVKNIKKVKNMFLWGVPSSIFIFLYTSLNFINYMSNINNFEFNSFIKSLSDLSIAIYIILFLFSINLKNEIEETAILETTPIDKTTVKEDNLNEEEHFQTENVDLVDDSTKEKPASETINSESYSKEETNDNETDLI